MLNTEFQNRAPKIVDRQLRKNQKATLASQRIYRLTWPIYWIG